MPWFHFPQDKTFSSRYGKTKPQNQIKKSKEELRGRELLLMWLRRGGDIQEEVEEELHAPKDRNKLQEG